MMAYFPVLLDFQDMPCLVAGGGRLGAHKAKLLSDNGAAVTVVAPEDCIGIEDAQAGIEARKAAGMYAVGINVAVTSVEPDVHLKSTSELDFDKIVF